MATYAIGDVQGCFEALTRLLEHVGFRRDQDTLWFVGDLVNRGPQSLETLRFVHDLGDRAVVTLGNHDLHLLAIAEGFAPLRADDTLSDILAAPDREPLLSWLRQRKLLHVEGGFAMVHAGLLPQWTLAQAVALAAEVEQALRAATFREFLAGMYGNRPDRWNDALQGQDRLRAVVNAMTRMRICTVDGVMNLGFSGERGTIPQGYFPWFEVPGRGRERHAVICGHWSALGLCVTPDLLAIDTGCLWGRQLTAVRLSDRKLFQVPGLQAAH